ncbi:MAG: type II secretion system F family protein, partial [Coriobacteriales bacterium]|nr:type II secretion system F family protein [Coriobacteriales bacterium]
MVFLPTVALTLAVVSAAFSGAAALPVVFEQGLQMLHRSRVQAKVTGVEKDRVAFLANLCRRGVSILRPISSLLLRVRWFYAKCECCAQALRIKGYDTGPSTTCELLVLLFGLVAAVALLLTRMPLVALCVAALVTAFVFGKAQKILDQWGERLIEQIPDSLRSLGICFNAGYSLQQAFEQTARDTPAPLGVELRQASFDIAAGRSVEEALSALEKRTKAA